MFLFLFLFLSASSVRLCVVDDSPINRTLMRRMLQSRQLAPSWQVEEAEKGEVALKLVRPRATCLVVGYVIHPILYSSPPRHPPHNVPVIAASSVA